MRRRLLTASVLATALFLPACGADEPAAPASGTPTEAPAPAAAPSTPAGQPQTVDAARAAAQAHVDAYAAGDWKGAWDLWTRAGKAAISRDEYHRLHTLCKSPTGLTFEITGVRLESPTVAVVNWKRSIAAGSHELHYEDGQWRWQPDQPAMADYAKGVDKAVADRKAEGSCG